MAILRNLTDEQIESVVCAWFDYTADTASDFVGRMRKALNRAASFERCQYCDGTGDVHSIDGEWRGECTECDASKPEHQTATIEDVSGALYSHLMRGAFDIGEAYLNLKCVGSCPSEDDFLAALRALVSAKEAT
jgi:uncharacterized paraquat-inducible protein A